MSQELARHEARAQHGIIEFAEEIQIIRERNLYPGAKREPDAWETYCKERWGMSRSQVDRTILALPVLTARAARGEPAISASTAAEVAELPEEVQEAILGETTSRDPVRVKAKAARKEATRIRTQEGREPENEELIKAATTVKPKKAKKPKHKSKFTSLLAQGVAHVEDAADYAQTNVLTDIENEFGWSRVEKLRLHADRIAECLTRPDHVRDWDEEAALLLAGDES
jgi:hypothetical protein